MTNSRRKGKDGELEVACILKAYGYADARRGQQYSGVNGDADVVGLPGVHIEVKRTEQFRLWDALEQSEGDARDGEVPIVVHRKSRKPWVVVQTFASWLEMYERSRVDGTCKECRYEFCLSRNCFDCTRHPALSDRYVEKEDR